ncbi:MAG TPA: lysophospholipid acyltransferase family protein [Candidatus Dormibacteraeota bacterium]|jgi:KDO2-lipid IV(A) lauroyltransferase|nr:lysophospholipid acyltransferase family protein [Candidatus Dormibacteraeota bacterium]
MKSATAVGFRVGNALVSRTPAPLRYGAARLFGSVAYLAGRGTRRQALENYAGVVHQPMSSSLVRRTARESMVGYAKLLADFMLLPSLRPEQIDAMVEWDGYQNIELAMAQERGVIVVTPHFGNWDIAAAAAARRGLPLTAVTEHFGNDGLNQEVVAARERIGMKVVPLSVSAGKAVLTALRHGELVALVCDLPPKEGRTLTVRVCGQDAVVPAGPATLALRTGAPVVPIMCHRRADNRYLLEVQAPIDFEPSGDDDRDEVALAQAIMDRFEPTLLAAPEQWYLYSPMWNQAASTGGGHAEPHTGASRQAVAR